MFDAMWLLTTALLGYVTLADCNCVLPLTDGTWLTSGRGTWNVNNNSAVIENFKTSLSVAQPTSTLTCNSQTEAGYLLGTTIQALSNIVIDVYTCIDIRTTGSSPSKYLFHFVTPSDVTGERFTSNMSEACNNANYITALNTHVILKEGSDSSVATTLPNVIRGNYSVNYTDIDGASVTGSELDSCSDVTLMVFNKSDSGRTVAFSSSGLLACVYSVQDGSQFHVVTYNNDSTVDGSSTYSLVCWVFSYSTAGVDATVYPGACQSNQNATVVPSGGQTFQFLPYSVCPAESDAGSQLSTAVIIVIAIICCLVFVFAVVLIIFYLKNKGKPKKEAPTHPTKSIKAEKFTTVNETRNSHSDDKTSKSVKTSSSSSRDGPMTRWSKFKHRRRRRLERSKTSDVTHSSVPSGHTDGQIMIRKTYVSMAPTSLLFTDPSKVNNVSPRVTSVSQVDNSPEGVKRAKTMVEMSPRKSKRSVIYKQRNKIVSSDVTRNRLETLRVLRTRTFHEFSRDFDKSHAFPIETDASNPQDRETHDGDKSGAVANSDAKDATQAVPTVKSRPSTLKSRPSTTDGVLEKPNKPKAPAKRTQSESFVGYSYNSPYGMTQRQKEYMAERSRWIRNMKQQDVEEERLLTDQRKQENTSAYKAWLKNKAKRTQTLKRSYVIKKKIKPRPETGNTIKDSDQTSTENQVSQQTNTVIEKQAE